MNLQKIIKFHAYLILMLALLSKFYFGDSKFDDI